MKTQLERYFKITARVAGMREPFVDWYSGVDEAEARALWDEDAHRYGVPLDASLSVEELSAEQWNRVTQH